MELINETTFTGGCKCGKVRYAVKGRPDGPSVCYCEDCRKSVGAASVAWVSFPSVNLSVTAGIPKIYRSSETVERLFCPECGTSLAYKNSSHPDHVDITIASLDKAGEIAPDRLVYPSQKLPWDRPLDLPTGWDIGR